MMTEQQAEDWRRKYYESLRTIEHDEQEYRDQLLALRKLISRLCLIALGLSPRIDATLQQLKVAINHDPVPLTELEKIGVAIADALKELEHDSPSPQPRVIRPLLEVVQSTHAATTAMDPRISDVLSRLLHELRRDSELAATANTLDAELANTVTSVTFPALLERIGNLVTQRIRTLEKARSSLETLLEQMVARLDELSRFIAGEKDSQDQQSARREAFSTQVASEVQALEGVVENTGEGSTDFTQLRSLLKTKLDSIGRRLQEFRKRETDYARETRERSEKMRVRIEQLESEAHSLHQRLQEEKRAAMLDPLTQVCNRLAWEQRIAEEMERWQRHAQPTCIATWDVDHFKHINDSYGHTAGDKVLKVIAECLSKKIRTVDFLARYGGEEFVTILPNTTLENGMAIVDRIREAVSEIGFHFSGKRIVITISCGITALREGDSANAAFERADQAMYRAKQQGRNRVLGD
jgi:diguanylate cyclase